MGALLQRAHDEAGRVVAGGRAHPDCSCHEDEGCVLPVVPLHRLVLCSLLFREGVGARRSRSEGGLRMTRDVQALIAVLMRQPLSCF